MDNINNLQDLENESNSIQNAKSSHKGPSHEDKNKAQKTKSSHKEPSHDDQNTAQSASNNRQR